MIFSSDKPCIVTTLRLPGADLVEELFPVLALGPLVRAGDINHFGVCDYGGIGIRVPNLKVLLGDKMNLTVRLGKLFYESYTGVAALLPCSQLPRQARGTLRKLFT